MNTQHQPISPWRQLKAFLYRDHALTVRYWSWVVVFTFYALVSAATVTLIGVAANDPKLTVNLTIGVLLWSFLSVLFSEIAMSIAYERWEGTLEYTFMAPVSRLIHLFGVSIYAMFYSLLRMVVVLGGLFLFLNLDVRDVNVAGILLVLFVSSFAFIGLGLVAAVLPVMSPERGAEATNIVQSVLLLLSGIYYPISVLPAWLRPLSTVSPATYALQACRKLAGTEGTDRSLAAVFPELGILVVMGIVSIPLGLLVFGSVERWAKSTGKLKRTG